MLVNLENLGSKHNRVRGHV